MPLKKLLNVTKLVLVLTCLVEIDRISGPVPHFADVAPIVRCVFDRLFSV